MFRDTKFRSGVCKYIGLQHSEFRLGDSKTNLASIAAQCTVKKIKTAIITKG
jgi:hypothetical protein